MATAIFAPTTREEGLIQELGYEDYFHDHHHGDKYQSNFVSHYIFSQDHKMIAKQYLISGLIMGFIGIAMSMLMRLQLAWPNETFWIYEVLLGRFGEDGVMDPSIYLALSTIHGTIMIFYVLTAGLSGTFSNLLIPLQIGARDMASGFMNMLSFWLFFISCVAGQWLPLRMSRVLTCRSRTRFLTCCGHHSMRAYKL